ncbi:MAG: M48 family metallopeptidase [Bacteroidetes bacterium]|nr:M48 family metallopeptidase [Bacteroidota bacterium]
MNKVLHFGFIFLLMSFFFSCTENKVTGRKQLKLLPESELQSMAFQQYNDFLKTNKIVPVKNNANAAMVQRVGNKIAKAITDYYTAEGQAAVLDGFKWEFNLVDDAQINAWCMPGGKVVVYTGLLPVTKTEAGLAVVMGHEIAHALALHGNERVSQGMLQQFGGIALQVALSEHSAEMQNLFMNAYGIGTTVGAILPFSRKHELEADRFGLRFSAMAGYDPNEGVELWKRMGEASKGQKPPELLSTHPSDETRIEKMKKYAEEASKYYRKP